MHLHRGRRIKDRSGLDTYLQTFETTREIMACPVHPSSAFRTDASFEKCRAASFIDSLSTRIHSPGTTLWRTLSSGVSGGGSHHDNVDSCSLYVSFGYRHRPHAFLHAASQLQTKQIICGGE